MVRLGREGASLVKDIKGFLYKRGFAQGSTRLVLLSLLPCEDTEPIFSQKPS